MAVEEKIVVESVRKWTGRWLSDMSEELLSLNPVPSVRRVTGGGKDKGKNRVGPGEGAVSGRHKVPAEMVSFLRKRYGDDVVIYMEENGSGISGEGIIYSVKLIHDDGSKRGRSVGIAEVESKERRGGTGGKTEWYVIESRMARERWKERYMKFFVAQYGEKALEDFLNRS